MSNAYRAVVSAGGGAAVGDATAADVLTGKTFSGAVGSGVSGTMPNNGAVTQTVSAGQSYTIPAGYHNGSGTVTGVGGVDPVALTTNVVSHTNNYEYSVSCEVGQTIIVAWRDITAYTSVSVTGVTQILAVLANESAVNERNGYCFILKATSSTVTISGAKSGTAAPYDLTAYSL